MPPLSRRQNLGPVVEAAVAGRQAGVLRRAVYREVADLEGGGKNLRECVRRIDGADEVLVKAERLPLLRIPMKR